MKTLACLLLAGVLTIPAQSPAQRTIDELLDTLQNDPADLSSISKLAKHPEDPRVVPTLRHLFIQAKSQRTRRMLVFFSVPVAREVARVLMNLGIRDLL